MKSWIEEPAIQEDKLRENEELLKAYIQNCIKFSESALNSLDNSISKNNLNIFSINYEKFSANIMFFDGMQNINIKGEDSKGQQNEIIIMRKDHSAIVKYLCTNKDKSRVIYEIPCNLSFNDIADFKQHFTFPEDHSSISIIV